MAFQIPNGTPAQPTYVQNFQVNAEGFSTLRVYNGSDIWIYNIQFKPAMFTDAQAFMDQQLKRLPKGFRINKEAKEQSLVSEF